MEKAIPGLIVRNKQYVNWIIKVRMLVHSFILVFAGKLPAAKFMRFVKRLLLFLSKMQNNKYIKVPTGTKINLYVPAFPSRAFFYATHKMLTFDKSMPGVTALVSVTSACRYNCEHCYQKNDKGKDVDLDTLIHAVKYFQNNGVAFFNIEGGEPFIQYERLLKVCKSIDKRSEILINSTGDGLTYQRLLELKKSCNLVGIMFSLHTHKPDQLNQFMRSANAWQNMENGIAICHQLNVPVMFNSCLLRNAYFDGTFEKTMDKARELGGSLIQLIKPKSAGAWLLEDINHFTKEELEAIKAKVVEYNNLKEYEKFPFIAAMIIDEDEQHFGCTAGGTDRFYLNAKGDIQPCEFLNVSFGNIAREPVEEIYEQMRRSFETPGTKWLCEAYHKKIAERFQAMDNDVLPLNPADTAEIINTEDHGEIPDFYNRAYKI